MENQPGKYERLRGRLAGWTGSVLNTGNEAQKAVRDFAKTVDKYRRQLNEVQFFHLRSQLDNVQEWAKNADVLSIEHSPIQARLLGKQNIDRLEPILAAMCGEDYRMQLREVRRLAREIPLEHRYGHHLSAVRRAVTAQTPTAHVYTDHHQTEQVDQLIVPAKFTGFAVGIREAASPIPNNDRSGEVVLNFYFSFPHPKDEYVVE